METNFINTGNEPVTYSYLARNNKRVARRLVDIKTSIRFVLNHYHAGELIINWYTTVFLNFAKRNPETLCTFLPNVAPDFVLATIDDFLALEFEMLPDDRRVDHEPVVDDVGKFIADTKESFPNWAKNGEVLFMGNFDILYSSDNSELKEVTDYLTYRINNQEPIDRLSVPDAFRLSEAWHKQQAKAVSEDVEGEDITNYMEFGNGIRMVRMLTPKALDRESNICDHCIGKGGYDAALKETYAEFYSLRDAENNPHATMYVNRGKILQLKGRGNGVIDEAYWAMIKDFILVYGFVLKADKDKIGLNYKDKIGLNYIVGN